MSDKSCPRNGNADTSAGSTELPANRDALDAGTRKMEFHSGLADKLHDETISYLDDYPVYTLREPQGVAGRSIPWNDPIQNIGRSTLSMKAGVTKF